MIKRAQFTRTMTSLTSPATQVASWLMLFLTACNAGDPEVATPPDAGITERGRDGGGQAPSNANDACVPQTCADLSAVCGDVENGCGRQISCGNPCAVEKRDGGTDPDACQPLGCAEQGKDCGQIDDSCGNELDCGDCKEGDCGLVVPNVCGCPSELLTTPGRTARHARSEGFSGTAEAYNELYDVPCEMPNDCAAACLDRGGSEQMCEASQCLENFEGTSDCLPASIWRNLESIRFESEDPYEGVELTVVFDPYADLLVTDEFAFEVPSSALVRGLTVEIHRAGDETVADNSVRIVKNGVIGVAERASPTVWSQELEWATYGGPDDLWGEQWTPNDINSADFGVALSVLYTRTAGNTRAYVDQVRVSVHYEDSLCSE